MTITAEITIHTCSALTVLAFARRSLRRSSTEVESNNGTWIYDLRFEKGYNVEKEEERLPPSPVGRNNGYKNQVEARP